MSTRVTQYFPDDTRLFLDDAGNEIARIDADGTFSIGTQTVNQKSTNSAIDEELERLREESAMLDYVIDRRDFLWDHWDMTSEEVKQAIREAMKNDV